MRMSTKTLASMLLVTAVGVAMPGISRLPSRKRRQESQFDRIIQHHDRKGELRAEVLGLDPFVFRDLQHQHSFQEIAKQRGFVTTRDFRIALFGKLKDELHKRGWTDNRIKHYMMIRSGRLG